MAVIKSLDGMAFWASGDVILVIWQSPARIQRTRWLFDLVDAAVARNPGGIIGLQLVLPTASPPDGPAREENHLRMRRIGGLLRRLVTVPLGDALWMSLVRTIMRAITLVTGQARSQFVGSTEAEGLDLLLKAATPATPSRAQLMAALEDLYRALGIPRNRAAA